MLRPRLVLILTFALVACPVWAQVTQPPLTEVEVRDLIKQNRKDLDPVYKALDARGVDFDLNRDIEKKMRKAGADDAMLQAIWKAGPTAKNAKTALLTSATGKSLEATYEEAMGYKTLQDEVDPDRKLSMVEEYASRFPKSALLSYVYTQAARTCQQKSDVAKVVEYGEKSLKLDPDNIYTMLILGLTLGQPRQQSSPEDMSRRLSSAENYAHRSLTLIPTITKRAAETDEQLQKRKASLSVDAHAALGLVEMQRGDPAKAIDDFQAAISLAEKPNPQYYFRIGEVYENVGKRDEAIAAFSKVMEIAAATPLGLRAEQHLQSLKSK